jgi:DNA-binding NarL/FixJ family response regulator
MSETIHLILIESHAMVRAGFRMLFEAQPDMAVIGESESGSEGLALLETVRPDVLLLDVSMPAMGGPEITTLLKARFPDVRILALTIHDSQADLLQMLDAGVDGYLPKRAAAEELLKAVRALHAGERYVHPSLVGPLVLPLIGRDPARPEEKPPSGVLTHRQLQVLGLVANGLTSQKVGEALGLSGRTVDRHIENMLRKLKMHSRVELVLYAIREGLIDVEDRSS